jgi:hypothetical protein
MSEVPLYCCPAKSQPLIFSRGFEPGILKIVSWLSPENNKAMI